MVKSKKSLQTGIVENENITQYNKDMIFSEGKLDLLNFCRRRNF
jgi:hypothetical protein